MPDRPPITRDDPSFFRFPLNNARTGYQPVFLPLVLIEPRRRTASGFPTGDSNVFGVRFFITDAPRPARVAGPFNTGILVPDSDIFSIDISALQLAGAQIDLTGQPFRDSEDNEIDFEDAKEGDTFTYSLVRNLSTAQDIPFFPDANYYDLSEFTIDVEDLPKPERYLFVWQVKFFRRITNAAGEFVCVSDEEAISQFNLELNHPGEVHFDMVRRTPALYYEQDNPIRQQDDLTIKFYRPFADILQDIFDEQSLIEGINHINRIPAQLIPYLAFLIGWDLPNYPGVTDNVRRNILRNAVKLLQLKGSRRAIVELFDLLGFLIEILNLWSSSDGTRFIAPGENLPSQLDDEEISTSEVCQVEPVVSDFGESGFGDAEIPLVFRPIGNITLDAWLVDTSSSTYTALIDAANQITDDPEAFGDDSCVETVGGFLIPQKLLDSLPPADSGVISTAQVVIDVTTGVAVEDISAGDEPPISAANITYNREKNLVNLIFDHFLDLSSTRKVFVFATYERIKIEVPDEIAGNRSNRFDIRVLLRSGELVPDQRLLEFLINFLFKLKAFHSLLRKIIFTQILPEVYAVQDFCLGGDVEQSPGTDAGDLQSPPAIIPTDPVGGTDPGCSDEDISRGFKNADFFLRQQIIDGLKEEHAAWKALDGTHENDPLLESLSRLEVSKAEGTQCQFTQFGQDRVEDQTGDFDHEEDNRPKVCDITAIPLPDNCFKGRVEDKLDLERRLICNERFKCRACDLEQGDGVYWTYPVTAEGQASIDKQIESQSNSKFLGKLLRQYNSPKLDSLHFSNRLFFAEGQDRNDRFLALQRPSLDIQRTNLGFPGHRFPTQDNLLEDFIHPEHRAKPWDDAFSDLTCNQDLLELNLLNAQLIVGSDGNEQLVFDDADLLYEGNGIEPDISSYGVHDPRTFKVTHLVFMNTTPSHPALTLESVIITNRTEIEFNSAVGFDPLFNSFNAQCNKDFIDGYPAECDRFDIDLDAIRFDRTISDGTDEIGDALDLPPVDDITDLTSLFTYDSQILLEEGTKAFNDNIPLRYDCNCEKFPCGTEITGAFGTELTVSETESLLNVETCDINSFLVDGSVDPECDRIEVERKLILRETFGTCSTLYDGTIPSFLCQLIKGTDGRDVIPDGAQTLTDGEMFFKDDYGIIYEVFWTFIGNRCDITVTTKSPRVWGEPNSGFIENRKVFRRGIVTTVRQIIEFDDTGYEIIGEGFDQRVEVFQSTFGCGDEKIPEDDNCFHFDCQAVDEFVAKVTCGPRWADPSDPDDTDVLWPDLLTDSGDTVTGKSVPTGSQPFAFIDVWNTDPDDVIAVCPGTGGT